MKRILMLLVVAAVCAVGWYVVTPRSTVDDLREAANAGDATALEELIDFDSVRSNLKADLRGRMMDRSEEPDAELSRIGAALGGLFVDGAIDLFISPAGLASVLRGNVPERDGSGSGEMREYTIDRRGPDRFHVRFEGRDGEARTPMLEFRRDGLSWEMVRIRLE